MASTKLTFDGLAELKTALRNLPKELTAEAGYETLGAANGAASDIRRNYKPGMESLMQAVVVERTATGPYAAGALVRTRHKLAWIFENGTQVRHNRRGANRGAIQPPLHAFVPPAMRARKRMYQRLADMLKRQGFVVSGTP